MKTYSLRERRDPCGGSRERRDPYAHQLSLAHLGAGQKQGGLAGCEQVPLLQRAEAKLVVLPLRLHFVLVEGKQRGVGGGGEW